MYVLYIVYVEITWDRTMGSFQTRHESYINSCSSLALDLQRNIIVRPTGVRGRLLHQDYKASNLATVLVIVRHYFGETPARVLEGQVLVERVNIQI